MVPVVASLGTTAGQAAVDALSLGCLYALIALGIALIFGVMGLINFAYGEFAMAGGYVAAYLAGTSNVVLVIGVISAAVAIALVTERVAFRPLRDAAPATLLVASFGVSVVLQNSAQMAFGALPKGTAVLSELSQVYTVGTIQITKLSIVTVATTVVLVVALVAFLRFTDLGLQMRAAAENFSMARLMGVRANRVIAAAFAISGLLVAAASLILVAQTGTVTPTMGVNVVVIAFVATILGGSGSLLGAVIGGILVGALTVVLQTALPFELRSFRDAFVFTLILATLVLRPQGLLVAKARRQRI